MRTLIERYYSQFYYINQPSDITTTTTNNDNTNVNNNNNNNNNNQINLEDQYVNQHTNELAIIGVAPTHPCLSKDITKIDFMEKAVNNEVSGVRKAGGFRLQKNTILCVITCSDGSTYNLRSCIKGKLLEVNKEIIKDPSILKLHHATSGYLAIIDPVIKKTFLENEGLISFEAYHQLRNIPIQKGPVFLKDSLNDENE